MCSRERQHYFKPLRKAGLVEFFETVEDLPCAPTYDKLMNLVWKDDFYKKAIFDLKSVNKYHVEGMFLQLIAARLIGIEPWKGELRWVICREAKSQNGRHPPYKWKNDDNWAGMTLFDENRKWLNDVLKK